jgi:hypothetical protein
LSPVEMAFIIHAIHECVLHEKIAHRFVSEAIFSYSGLLEKIWYSFKLAPSSPIEISYKDHVGDYVSVGSDEGLVDGFVRQKLNALVVRIVHKCRPPFVKVVHHDTCRVYFLPPRKPEICYKELRAGVCEHFKLLPSADFCFRYKESGLESAPQIIISNDEELKYALTKESPNHLQLEISITQEDDDKITAYSSG